MKQIIFIAISLISIFLSAQNTFIYELKAKEKTEINVKSGSGGDFIKTYSNPIQYTYLFNESKASFKPQLKLENSQTIQVDLLQLSAKTLGEYYLDYDKKIIENTQSFNTKDYVVISNFDDLHWTDEHVEEVINGYKTKKYSTKRTEKGLTKDKIYTTMVWVDESYSQDIAPFGLTGLKGLIVKVDFNGGNELVLYQTAISKISRIEPFQQKNVISKQDYQKLIDDKMEELRQKRQEKMDFK